MCNGDCEWCSMHEKYHVNAKGRSDVGDIGMNVSASVVESEHCENELLSTRTHSAVFLYFRKGCVVSIHAHISCPFLQ